MENYESLSSNQDQLAVPKTQLRLDDFRDVLIRQEETIIFALIERAQFPLNDAIYKPVGGLEIPRLNGRHQQFNGSFLDFMFCETEKLHASLRRYTSPDEEPYYPTKLATPLLPPLNYPEVIRPNSININNKIMSIYLTKLLPLITKPGNDSTGYGSATATDIAVLQALSKRIHYGKYIAEAKFQANTTRYTELILANDADGLMQELCNVAVEEKVIRRVFLKASTYGQDIDGMDRPMPRDMSLLKVDPKVISELYRDYVMPLTKEVQVLYLLQRLDHDAVAYFGSLGSSAYAATLSRFGNKSRRTLTSSESIAHVFESVMSNKVVYGVVPFDDPRKGLFKETLQQLLSSTSKVCGEVYVKKSIVLATKTNSSTEASMISNSIEQIEQVVVPIDMEGICANYIDQFFRSKKVIVVENEVEAARQASLDSRIAAITTPHAAASENLHLVERNLEGTLNESIRYAVIGKSCEASTGKDRTCICLSVKHQSGGLACALEIFSRHNINLTFLESIPCEENYQYSFFVEMDGNENDVSLTCAFKELTSRSTNLRILGSYAKSSI